VHEKAPDLLGLRTDLPHLEAAARAGRALTAAHDGAAALGVGLAELRAEMSRAEAEEVAAREAERAEAERIDAERRGRCAELMQVHRDCATQRGSPHRITMPHGISMPVGMRSRLDHFPLSVPSCMLACSLCLPRHSPSESEASAQVRTAAAASIGRAWRCAVWRTRARVSAARFTAAQLCRRTYADVTSRFPSAVGLFSSPLPSPMAHAGDATKRASGHEQGVLAGSTAHRTAASGGDGAIYSAMAAAWEARDVQIASLDAARASLCARAAARQRDDFVGLLGGACARAATQLAELQSRLAQADAHYAHCTRFFAESAERPSHEFFGLFADFLAGFDRACVEIHRA
jgi:hypothetical protein